MKPEQIFSITCLNAGKPWRQRVFRIQFMGKSVLAVVFANSQSSREAKHLIERFCLPEFVQKIHFVTRQLTICEYVEGETLGIPTETKIGSVGMAEMENLGVLLGRIHQRGQIPPQDCSALFANWPVRIATLLDWASNQLGASDFHLLSQIMENTPVSHSTGVIHGDIHVGNVIVRQGRMKLIDTTIVRVGFQEEDLARVLFRIPYASHTNEQLKYFIQGYTQVLAIDSLVENQRFWEIYSLLRAGYGRRDQDTTIVSLVRKELVKRLRGEESIIKRILEA